MNEIIGFVTAFCYAHPFLVTAWFLCGFVNDAKRFHDERIFFHLVDLVGLLPALAAVAVLYLSGPIGTAGLILKWWQGRERPAGIA